MGRARSRLGALLVGGGLIGCWEIPPKAPPNELGAPISPAVVAYAPDPFHPLNRWFRRAFERGGDSGGESRILPPPATDEPLPPFRTLAPVDCAELIALLEAGAAERLEDETSLWLFQSDALALACRIWEASRREAAPLVCQELVRALLRAAASRPAPGALEGELPCRALPPPLRQGRWIDAEPPASSGLMPAAEDPRWSRLLVAPEPRGPPPEARRTLLLLRLRVSLQDDGAPLLLPLSSECWELEGGPGKGTVLSLWRFDRARWVGREDPWRAQALEEGGAMPWTTASLDGILSAAPSTENARAAAQLERLRSVLRAVVDLIPGSPGGR